MAKNQRKLITLIVTKDYPSKLKRLLLSIERNTFLSTSETFVIDTSKNKNNRFKNSQIINKNKKGIKYIDKTTWVKIRKILLKRVGNNNAKRLLLEIKLGSDKWDVHHARNVASIILSLRYRDPDVVVCLDDDMVIPKEFSFRESSIKCPQGIRLKGSPDLSRLEWIKLYLSMNKKEIGKKEKEGYPFHLGKKYGKSFLRKVIGTYTNLLKTKKIKHLKIFPVREELNAGSCILPIKYISSEPYSSWFDNDWFWFDQVKKKKYPTKFIEKEIAHLSSEKDIFNKKFLRFEEVGKIITSILKGKKEGYIPKKNEIDRLLKKKARNVERDIKTANILRRKNKGKIFREALIKIISNLKFISKVITTIKKEEIVRRIAVHARNSKTWKILLKEVGKSDWIKRELFRILDKGGVTIFSPHCDDVIFSLGGSIEERYFKNIKVYTVYTKTNYIRGERKPAKYVTKLRCAEDKLVLGKMQITPNFLKFKDSTGRGYFSEKDYLSQLLNPLKDKSFSKVREEISKIIKSQKNRIFLFPLGLGYHIDHRIMFKIGKELMEKYKILFYEDVGYDMTKQETLISKYIKSEKLKLEGKTFYLKDIKNKLKLCRMYETQISAEVIKNIKDIAKRRNGERIWSTSKIFGELGL